MKKLVLISVILLAFFSSCSPGKKVVVSSSSDPVEKVIRNGLSYETAIVIEEKRSSQGIQAEYDWLRRNYPGYIMQKQSLRSSNKVPYDVITIRTAEGETKEIFFEISAFFGK